MRVPPPVLLNGLRPSSADRAPRANISSDTSSAAASGSRMTGYVPGASSCRSREATAFSVATRAAAAASSRVTSFWSTAAEPEPASSVVRIVTEYSATVERWYPNRPVELSRACTARLSSR
jgi:hypothetical protein